MVQPAEVLRTADTRDSAFYAPRNAEGNLSVQYSIINLSLKILESWNMP